MKADLSRDTFDQQNNFLRVLMQQGRVQVDADWNEQTSILLHFLQSIARDLIGPHGGNGFKVQLMNKNAGGDVVEVPPRWSSRRRHR